MRRPPSGCCSWWLGRRCCPKRRHPAPVAGRAGHAGRAGCGLDHCGSGPRFTVKELTSLNDTIQTVLPLGLEEWETVAELHGNHSPGFNRCSVNLKQKFKEMYSSKMPTGDPNCHAHIKTAKQLHRQIQERLDTDNLDGSEVDLGIDDSLVTENGEGEVAETGYTGTDPQPRQLFVAPTARPLVRTPITARWNYNNNKNNNLELLTIVVADMEAARNDRVRDRQNEATEQRERQQERQQDRQER
jgi:hypothetical protein